jgi:type I site-specific restriction endonuclease
VLVLAHRDELIQQACHKLRQMTGVLPTVEKADQWSDEENMHGKPPLVVSSIQTQSRGRMNRFKPEDFSLVIADEAHHAVAESWTRVIDYYATNAKCKIQGRWRDARQDVPVCGRHLQPHGRRRRRVSGAGSALGGGD